MNVGRLNLLEILMQYLGHGGADHIDGLLRQAGVIQLQVMEENAIRIVVVVLAGMSPDDIKMLAGLLMTADRRMISGRVLTMISNFNLPLFLKDMVL